MTACTVLTVSGPPATDGRITFDASKVDGVWNPKGEVYSHGSRTETPCPCPAYLGDGGDCRRAECGHARHAHLRVVAA